MPQLVHARPRSGAGSAGEEERAELGSTVHAKLRERSLQMDLDGADRDAEDFNTPPTNHAPVALDDHGSNAVRIGDRVR